MKYTFGYGSEDAVEIPELDAFRADLDAVCRKHGVAFEIDTDWDSDSGRGYVKLVVYRDGANDDLFSRGTLHFPDPHAICGEGGK